MEPLVKQAIAYCAQQLRASLGSELLAIKLFGSHARGEASPESDVDLFVLVKKRTREIELMVSDAAFETNLAFGVFIAPTVYDEREVRHPVLRGTPFLQAIEREGVVV